MKKLLRAFVYLIIFLILFLVFSRVFYAMGFENVLVINITGENMGEKPIEVFYIPKGESEFTQENSVAIQGKNTGRFSDIVRVPLPNTDMSALRIDLGENAGAWVNIASVEYKHNDMHMVLGGKELTKLKINQVKPVFESAYPGLTLITAGSDPYIVIDKLVLMPVPGVSPVYPAAVSLLLTLFVFRFVHLRKIVDWVRGMISERSLIMRLAVNDFKTRFAGSSFGVIWAFVQPICTILVFWFVFQIGFRNPNVGNVQYILWFMTGLIPWFFFSEAWNSATNAFIEYSYLVKKVVFKINILPFIKIISALFVHMFFVLFMITVYALYHRFPTVYYLQLIYYMFCMVVLVSALSFITAPLVIFFRDISQIMSIVLQFGMWLTPIMWSVDSLPQGMGVFVNVFKINPMYYIVQGYRNSMIYNVPFYDNILQTVYFWVLMLVLIIMGSTIYTRLKPHFADVL